MRKWPDLPERLSNGDLPISRKVSYHVCCASMNHRVVLNIFRQMKVGASLESDLRRSKIMRSIIDDPGNFPKTYNPPAPERLVGKNAGPMGTVIMFDANQASHIAYSSPGMNIIILFLICVTIGLGRARVHRLCHCSKGSQTLVSLSTSFLVTVTFA